MTCYEGKLYGSSFRNPSAFVRKSAKNERTLVARLTPVLLYAAVPDGRARPREGPDRKVVRVTDGETLTLFTADKQQHRIRAAGIGAPEKYQPFGNRSKEYQTRLA